MTGEVELEITRQRLGPAAARRAPPSRTCWSGCASSTPRVAVERNREIVPKAEYGATALAQGDVVEVVELVGEAELALADPQQHDRSS